MSRPVDSKKKHFNFNVKLLKKIILLKFIRVYVAFIRVHEVFGHYVKNSKKLFLFDKYGL